MRKSSEGLLRLVARVLFLVSILSIPAHASSELPKDLSYRVLSRSTPKSDSDRMAEVLQDRGLVSVATGGTKPISIFWMDQIFAKPDLSAAVFVKFNVEVTNPQYFGRILPDQGDGFIYHGRAHGGTPFAIYFLSFSEKDTRNLVSGIEKQFGDRGSKQGNPNVSIINMLVPSAFADQIASGDIAGPGCSQVGSSSSDAKILSRAWNCLKGAALGAWDATGGLIVSAFDGTSWSSIKFGWNAMKTLYSDFKGTVEQSYNEIRSLPSDVQAKMFCEIATGAITTLSISVTTGGGASLALGTNWMTRVLTTLETSSKYAKLFRDAKTRCHGVSNETRKAASGTGGVVTPEQDKTDTSNATSAH